MKSFMGGGRVAKLLSGVRASGRRQGRWRTMAAMVGLAVVLGAGPVRASTEVYVYSTNASTTLSFQGGGMVGVTYKTLGSAITFNSLGFIDIQADPPNYNYYYNPDGLLGSYQVGIWLNSAPGTLLASTTVTTSSTLIGNFRYAPIAAVTIAANTDFTIGALLPDTMLDGWLKGSLSNNSSNITGAGSGRVLNGATTLSYPSQIGDNTYAIVNASTASVVPEPSSAVCLVVGLGWLALFRSRSRVAAGG